MTIKFFYVNSRKLVAARKKKGGGVLTSCERRNFLTRYEHLVDYYTYTNTVLTNVCFILIRWTIVNIYPHNYTRTTIQFLGVRVAKCT